MNNILETVKSFLSMVDARFAIATIVMIVIFVAICFLAFLTITSIQKRREAINVELPNLNDQGEIETNEPQFEKDKIITVELVDPNEDTAEGEPDEKNDETFIEALTMETKVLVQSEEVEVDMPVVGEIDYEQIKEERKKEIDEQKKARESAVIDHLREVAKADSEEDLSDIEKLNREMNEDSVQVIR